MNLKHSLAAFGSLVVLAACHGGESDNGSAVTPEIAVSALSATIADCQTDGATCVEQARSPQELQACNAMFGQCLLAVAPTRREVAQSYADCQSQARECVIRGGGTEATVCRAELDACLASIGADDDAGMPDGPDAPSADAGIPSLPRPGGGLPGFPRGGGGGIGGLPLPGGPLPGGGPLERQRAAYECLSAMRECVVAGAKSPMECAQDAQTCIANPTTPTAGSAAPTP